MSMKYLDKTGLAYFWSKIKDLLNLKVNIYDLATVATSGDYKDLSNLPVAGVDYQTPLKTEGATELGIDTVVTQNSSNLITSGAVYNVIPTELADLNDDSTHRVVTDSQVSAWSNKQDQTITDNHNYFTATTVEGALDELGAAKINPISKTSAMTQEVGKDSDGKLWTSPGSSGTGVTDHADLTGRDSSEQHPISAITNLQTVLDSKLESVPKATESAYGGIKAGASTNADNMPIHITADGFLRVAVPDVTGLENKGKITVDGTTYTVTRKPLTITNNGTTTTYYIADIT